MIAGLDKLAHADVDELLSTCPRSRVLAVATDRRQSVLYELRPHERLLGEMSPGALLAAVRDRLGAPRATFERASKT
jgi:hypothetical protein